MAHGLRLIAELCIAGAVVGCACTLAAAIIVLIFRPAKRPAANSTSHPPVTLLKPLHGADPELFERLVGFCTQDYRGPVQLVFGVQAASDPAVEVVRRLQGRFPDLSIALQIEAREHGCNRKLSNLINMLPLARHDVLVFSDSDMVVGPKYLADVVAPLEEPVVGAVTCLYHGLAAESIPSRLAALAINSHFLPQVVAALRFGLAQPCFGATIAIRRLVLNRIGGLRAFADVLADDFAIGSAVRSAGFEVELSVSPIGHACIEREAATTLSRELRVARTIKLIDPVGYAGTIIAHPFALALIASLLGAAGAGGVVVCALASRVILCACVQRAFGLQRQSYWLIPLHDVIAFTIYMASFAGATVTWQGYRYRVADDGTIVEDAARSG